MPHEIAKLILEHADTFLIREEAIRTAMRLGMPLHEIQDYLDWLDFVKGGAPPLLGRDEDSTDEANDLEPHDDL